MAFTISRRNLLQGLGTCVVAAPAVLTPTRSAPIVHSRVVNDPGLAHIHAIVDPCHRHTLIDPCHRHTLNECVTEMGKNWECVLDQVEIEKDELARLGLTGVAL
jgi:hypothetical protein